MSLNHSLLHNCVTTPARAILFIMGTGKKEAARHVRQGKTGDGLGNVRVKGENFYRLVKDSSYDDAKLT